VLRRATFEVKGPMKVKGGNTLKSFRRRGETGGGRGRKGAGRVSKGRGGGDTHRSGSRGEGRGVS